MTKVALITGTSTGVGLATSVVLAKAGFRVVATMRDLEKSKALRERAQREGVELDVRRLDVADQASVDSCIPAVLSEYGHIDVLVNNAGAGRLGSMEHMPVEVVQQVLEVNFLGVWRVTQAVLPSMRKARSGRIVTVTSVGGIVGQAFSDAYCAAKFAVEGAMEALAIVVKQLGVRVSLIEPGPIKTEFLANAHTAASSGPATPEEGYEEMLATLMANMGGRFAELGQTGDDVARVILEAATSEAPHFRYPTSEFARMFMASKLVDTTGDALLAQMSAPFAQNAS